MPRTIISLSNKEDGVASVSYEMNRSFHARVESVKFLDKKVAQCRGSLLAVSARLKSR